MSDGNNHAFIETIYGIQLKAKYELVGYIILYSPRGMRNKIIEDTIQAIYICTVKKPLTTYINNAPLGWKTRRVM